MNDAWFEVAGRDMFYRRRMRELLELHKTLDVNAGDPLVAPGLNPLGYACKQGDVDAIAELLAHGADVSKAGPALLSPRLAGGPSRTRARRSHAGQHGRSG